MAGEIGKSAAEELKGKIDVDEQRKEQALDDETYDAQLLKHLQERMKAEIESFNEQAKAADQLKMEKGSSMLQLFRDNKPAFAVMVQHRQVMFLDPRSTAPVCTLRATGGPEEYAFLSGPGSAAAMGEDDMLKGLLRMAAGAMFEGR